MGGREERTAQPEMNRDGWWVGTGRWGLYHLGDGHAALAHRLKNKGACRGHGRRQTNDWGRTIPKRRPASASDGTGLCKNLQLVCAIRRIDAVCSKSQRGPACDAPYGLRSPSLIAAIVALHRLRLQQSCILARGSHYLESHSAAGVETGGTADGCLPSLTILAPGESPFTIQTALAQIAGTSIKNGRLCLSVFGDVVNPRLTSLCACMSIISRPSTALSCPQALYHEWVSPAWCKHWAHCIARVHPSERFVQPAADKWAHTAGKYGLTPSHESPIPACSISHRNRTVSTSDYVDCNLALHISPHERWGSHATAADRLAGWKPMATKADCHDPCIGRKLT
jgi:hypothetical protein